MKKYVQPQAKEIMLSVECLQMIDASIDNKPEDNLEGASKFEILEMDGRWGW
ncbi:MAG: hypothetical protein MJZ08_03175 [Bacteroidaceae bacterium]|nr:hypothetical protein [Bacteroidaceae bacterium]